ncbi:MAG TPA: ABC transporter permease [Bryobacteraceae bacterium]|nr:ABC transporter permease [Bryobacteraceae bacterium]
MSWRRQIARLRSLFRSASSARELDEEIRAHLELELEEHRAAGMPADEARYTARRTFGNVTLAKEESRDMWIYRSLEIFLQDVRFGLRMLVKNPGFTIVAVLTLALGIGANTAIFSLVNVLMLKSLPYAHPERMGTIYTRIGGPEASDGRHNVDGEQWELLRDNVPSLLSAVSGSRASGVNLGLGSQGQYLHAGRISAHYLDVLAIQPLLGRSFSGDEDRPHGPKAVILSYGLWRNTFRSDPNILGQPILLKGEPHTVIGVLPDGATTPLNADVYTALQASREGEGAAANLVAITRLREGATWQQADAEISRAWSLRTHRYELGNNPGLQVTYYSVPLQKGETDSLRPQVLALMLAAGFILLIACANLAGLTLVRMLRRQPEVATRLALGATRWQIQKQLWVENLLLAFVGGTAGVAVGFAALRGLLLLLPEHFLPVAGVPLDSGVLAFTLLISVLTSVLFGMLPALVTRNVDLRSSMTSRGVAGGGHLRLRQTLIVSEVALTVVLLAASGLLIHTLIHLETVPPGFNPVGVMTAKASLDDARYHDAAAFRKLLQDSTSAMRRIPGVQQAAAGLSVPYERSVIMGGIAVSGGGDPGQKVQAYETYITPDYFAALQIPILAGRSFTEADGPDAQRVAIVNQTFARKFFRGVNPVGGYLNKDTLIVGVAGNVATAPGLDADAPITAAETFYVPAAQKEAKQFSLLHVWFQPSWIVRTAGPVEGLTAQMQRALTNADPNLPFSGFYRMNDLVAKALAAQRVEVALMSAMAAMALLLSAVGVFALVANIVAQRTREIGIRMALGAGRRDVLGMFLGQGTRLAGVGIAVGLAAALGATRLMTSYLYGVRATDPLTFLAVPLLLAGVTLLATYIPARRAMRVDPMTALRHE